MANATLTWTGLRTGNSYTLTIGGVDNAMTLTGGATPFVTEEDDSDDALTPVRLQSGHISLVGTQAEWEALLPTTATSRPVTLTSGANTLWCGYVEADAYSMEITHSSTVQEFQLNVKGQLGMLEGVEFDADVYDMTNIAYILWIIFRTLDTQPNYIYFPPDDPCTTDTDSDGNRYAWLAKKVSWRRFGTLNPDGTYDNDFSCLEVLEEICKYFGWTCHEQLGNIYFTAGYDENYFGVSSDCMTMADLADFANASATSRATSAVAPGNYASTSNDYEMTRGWNKCEVNEDFQKFDAFEIDTESFEDACKTSLYGVTTWVTVEDWAANQDGEGYRLLVASPFNTSPWQMGLWQMTLNANTYSPSVRMCQYYDGVLADQHSVSLNTVWYIGKKTDLDPTDPRPTNSTPLQVEFVSQRKLAIQNGYLVLSGELWEDYISGSTHTERYYPGKLVTLIKFVNDIDGLTYYYGEDPDTGIYSWTTTKLWSFISIGWNSSGFTSGRASVDSNRPYLANCADWSGFGIPVTTAMVGTLSFGFAYFYGTNATSYKMTVSNLKMQFVSNWETTQNTESDSNSFKASNSSYFKETKNIDTIFSLWNGNSYGDGFLINDDGSWTEKLRHWDNSSSTYTYDYQGQYIANQVAAWGATSHKVVSIETDISSTWRCIADSLSIDSTTAYVLSIGADWRDEVERIRAVEI